MFFQAVPATSLNLNFSPHELALIFVSVRMGYRNGLIKREQYAWLLDELLHPCDLMPLKQFEAIVRCLSIVNKGNLVIAKLNDLLLYI